MLSFIHKKGKSNLVIFVHGFLGDENSWKNSDGISFPEMLISHKKIKDNYDFACFNYFTKLANPINSNLVLTLFKRFLGSNSKSIRNLNISSIGELFQSTIEYECANYETIIIVAHSMGGLVSKSCILEDIRLKQLTKIKLFISLAVPHQGSLLTENILAKLIPNPQAYDLKPVSDIVDTMNKVWVKNKEIPETYYFYGKYDTTVTSNCAIPVDPNDHQIIPCDDDHFTIAKPEKKTDHVYFVVQDILLKYVDKNIAPPKLTIQSFEDKGQFDDMNFVMKLQIAQIHRFFQNEAKNSFYNAEYAIKLLNPRKKSDIFKNLEDLYFHLLELYGEEFGKHCRCELDAGDALLSQVHSTIIHENDGKLKTPLPFLETIHKKGMLHQLANDLKNQIWWSKEHDETTLDDIKRKKVNSNV